MCIILTCESNVRPDHELLKTCFYNNPDGAGVMWVEDGQVQTSKGYMTLPELERIIDYAPKSSRMVIHMRIATSGGVDVGTCHPFPICDDLDILHASDVVCDAAVAHNGIIAGMPTDDKQGISDTVYFVSSIVNKMFIEEGLTKSVLRRMKKYAPNNRFAVMTKDGRVHRLGNGWETVRKGIQASNSTWRYDKLWSSNYGWGSYGDYDDDFDDSGYDPEYLNIFNTCCGDCCCRADCMTYEPYCPETRALVEDWYDCWREDEEDGWLSSTTMDDYLWTPTKELATA